jgi:hypothetical protein
LPGAALVGGAHDGGWAAPVGGVEAGGDVDLVGVVGIECEAFDAGEAGVFAIDEVGEGNPALAGVVRAVGSADVGAGVDEALLGGGEDEAVDESSAADDDILPDVRRCRLLGAGCNAEKQEGKGGGCDEGGGVASHGMNHAKTPAGRGQFCGTVNPT